MSFVYNS
ncbi:b11e63e3-1175-4808-8eb8-4e03c1091b58 [Thermothielavioides terrestris]|nr:b11e63e3-1175-4808-8eb8-4e03c1091b58 [Thermothielavioides terrestris]